MVARWSEKYHYPEPPTKINFFFDQQIPNFGRKAFVVGGDMGNEATQPAATKRSKHFWFVDSHLWWPGIAVGSKMSNEVTPIEATKRNNFFSCEALRCEAFEGDCVFVSPK